MLAAANLPQATAPVLAGLLGPVREAGLPVLGVISDAQESLRLAVGAVFPGVPHQLCQYHALREAAEPLWEADRHLLVEVKKELWGLRDVEAPRGYPVRGEEERAAADEVVPGTLWVTDALDELGQTLDRCLTKRGMDG